MLRKIRITVSVVLFSLITLYFLDFTNTIPHQFSLVAKIQFVPALLSLNVVILISLLLLTLIFGRVYCSSICPMGVYQDIVAWFSKKVNKKRHTRKKYTYSPAKTVLRISILVLTIAAFLFGFTFLVGLLDPYGAYGRMTTHLFRPVYLAGNNLLQSIFTQFGNYTFYKVSIYSLGVVSTAIALATLLIIGFLAWQNGRTYCNTICPVGTVLGYVSKFSLFKIQFNEENCNACGLCANNCKSSCINSKSHEIDYTRCVDCFDCIESCNRSAIKYAPRKIKITKGQKEIEASEIDESKRRFLSATAIGAIAATNLMAQKTGLPLTKEIKRKTPIAPPGSISIEHLKDKCISCHLCISKCPSHVIKPAFMEYGLSGMMQPVMYYDHGFCNYDCTLCSDVCPTEAISPLTKEMKHSTQMGKVHFIIEDCIVYKDETNCGACSEHCPTQAVSMIPYKNSLTIPHTDTSICVGCGGCEYVCPAKPHKAIYVEGLDIQNKVKFKKEKQEQVIINDFGF